MLIDSADVVVTVNDSVEKMTTKQNMIQAKDLATRLRKLKDSPYSNSEKAAMAIPAVKIWLIVRTIDTIPPTKLSNDTLSIEMCMNRKKQFPGCQRNHP